MEDICESWQVYFPPLLPTFSSIYFVLAEMMTAMLLFREE
jgi:hypothetical protein